MSKKQHIMNFENSESNSENFCHVWAGSMALYELGLSVSKFVNVSCKPAADIEMTTKPTLLQIGSVYSETDEMSIGYWIAKSHLHNVVDRKYCEKGS